MKQKGECWAKDGKTEHALVHTGSRIDENLASAPDQKGAHSVQKPPRLACAGPEIPSLSFRLDGRSGHCSDPDVDVRGCLSGHELRQRQRGLNT